MRKWIRVLTLILLSGFLVMLSGGLALGMYYRNNFPVNTWINGIYCTGKTIEEVNKELIEQTELPDISVLDRNGTVWIIPAEDIELKPDYSTSLKKFLKKNATAMWMNNLKQPVEIFLNDAEFGWNDAKLSDNLKKLDFVMKEEQRSTGCQVEYDEETGYFLLDGNTDRLNYEAALSYVKNSIFQGNFEISLLEGNCYENLSDDIRDERQRELWKQLDKFFSCKIVYDMGAEQIPLTKLILSDFLKADENRQILTDEDGMIVLDEERISNWVDNLAASYNTCDTVREFQSTRGDIVSVKYSTYGTELDADAEKEYLIQTLTEGSSGQELHVPAYKKEGFVRGLDDIGKTYIEVDMTNQHMYYYEDGVLKLDTDVVTGNTGRHMGTPEGINFVYKKQKDRILRGADYATPVKYWMPVKGSIGIHDASWRKSFGGEIYKRNGSHGCINTPPDVMEKLYEMVEIGTPVILFY